MDCSTFQDSLSDYLDGALESRSRAECAGHRLICRECRELYNDVRATVQTLGGMGEFFAEPAGLEERILAATTAGEMLSCGEFDRLIERYFDGVMLAPDHQIFQGHFEHCTKCRRLLAGIEDAIALCREVKEIEVEMPSSLPERIVSATTGKPASLAPQSKGARLLATGLQWVDRPQWAAAALIFAASLFLVSLRFGSLTEFATHANERAEKLLGELNQTSIQARSRFGRVSTQLEQAWTGDQPTLKTVQPAGEQLQPAAGLAESLPQVSPTPKLQKAVRYQHP
jgi:predicted anti-sigma-YlaC factor YlaD